MFSRIEEKTPRQSPYRLLSIQTIGPFLVVHPKVLTVVVGLEWSDTFQRWKSLYSSSSETVL